MLISRPDYFNKLLGYKDKKIIKVITGVRRCGKSTLLQLYKDYLLNNNISSRQVISINFDDYKYFDLLEAKALHAYIDERIIDNEKMYLFLDEIQNVNDYQRVVNSFYLNDKVDIYMTGSNSYMLSGELATLLTGRYIQIDMLPFSFSEFVEINGYGDNVDRAYQSYIETSSFPYVFQLDNELNQISDYLKSLYNTVVLKDIVARKNISDVMMLESVLRFLADNIGNILSTKKISDTMASDGRPINVRTVESYINAFLESYIVYQIKRYDIKGRQYLKTLEKYYLVDIGLRNTMLGSNRGRDVGHILENIIFLELLRRGYDLYIGKVEGLEIDFVAKSSNEVKYIQVAASVRDSRTFEREIRPLQKIQNNYPKCIMTLDLDPVANFEGIKKFNALDYLMKKVDF
jgi:uncharacterized protein